MHLKILLPNRVFLDTEEVTRMVLATDRGSLGVYPKRRDFVTALVPGIFSYETPTEGECFLAIDRGLAIKAGEQVLVSAHNATRGQGLGQLREAVEKELQQLYEVDDSLRNTLLKLETDMLRRIMEFRK